MRKTITALFVLLLFIPVFSAQKKQNKTKLVAAKTAAPPDTGGLFTNFDPNKKVTLQKKKGFSLKQILKRVLRSAPILKSSKASEQIYKAKIRQIKSERNPELSFYAGGFPAPHAPSAWNVDFKKWGFAGTTSLSINIPLYTFGRIPKGLKAAKSGLKVQQISTTSTKADLIYEIKKYYYGYLYAMSIKKYIMETVMEKLDKSLDKTEKDYKKGKVQKSSLYSLRIMKMDLLANQATLDKNLAVAKAAFKSFLDIPSNKKFQLQQDKINEKIIKLKPVDYYIKLAFRNNYQYRKAVFGLAAKKALFEYEKTKLNPILFAIIRASAAGSTNNIDTSWLMDNSSFSFFMGIGISYSTKFGKQDNIIDEKRADMVKLDEQIKMLKKKLPIDVKSAYLSVKEMEKKLRYRENAFLNGKRWMLHTYKMFMIDSASASDIRSGLSSYASTRKAYFNAIYNYYLAIANLSKLVGKDITTKLF